MPVVLPRDAPTQEASIVSRPRRYRSSSIPSVDTATVRPPPPPPPPPPLPPLFHAPCRAGSTRRGEHTRQENGKIQARTLVRGGRLFRGSGQQKRTRRDDAFHVKLHDHFYRIPQIVDRASNPSSNNELFHEFVHSFGDAPQFLFSFWSSFWFWFCRLACLHDGSKINQSERCDEVTQVTTRWFF